MKTFRSRTSLRFNTALVILIGLTIAGCSGENVPPPAGSLAKSKTTTISVFYPDGNILIEERQIVPVSDNLPEVALRRLFAASPEEHRIAIALPEATVRSLKVDKKTGICTADFSRRILDFPEDGRKAKIVAFASIIETLKQFPEVKKLIITVEGKRTGTISGKRIEDFWVDVTLKKQPIVIIRGETKKTSEGVTR